MARLTLPYMRATQHSLDSRGEVTVYSTLDGDYEADLSDHYMVYACEGDYYDFGYYNWMFIIAPNSGEGDCFQFDVITGYNDKESGFIGDYTASTTWLHGHSSLAGQI